MRVIVLLAALATVAWLALSPRGEEDRPVSGVIAHRVPDAVDASALPEPVAATAVGERREVAATGLLACAGRVVFDDSGEGVPGVELAVRGVGVRLPPQRTDRFGRFRFVGDLPAGQTVELDIRDPGPCVGLARPAGPWWGREDVVVRLPRASSVVVEVVGADDGEPIEDYGVRVRPRTTREIEVTPVGSPGPHPGGRALVGGAWPGANDLQIVPTSPRYAPSEVVQVHVGPRRSPSLRIALAPRRSVSVRVRDSVGRPVEGAAVRWIDTRGRGAVPSHLVEERALPLRPAWRHRTAVRVVDAGPSGADGSRLSHLDPDARALVLEVLIEGALFERSRFDFGAVVPDIVEVRVPAWSAVRGRLRPPPPAAWRPRVRVETSVRDIDRDRIERSAPLRADGSFDLGRVPDGVYRLVLAGRMVDRPDSAQITWLQDFVAAGGADVDLDLDGSSLAPAAVRGTVDLPPGRTEAEVAVFSGGRALRRARVAADGSFEVAPLWGRQGAILSVSWRDGDGQQVRRWDPAGPFALPWGQTVRRDVELGSAMLSVQVRGTAGRPARGRVLLEGVGWPRWIPAETGEDGIARFGQLAAGRYAVNFVPAGESSDRALGEVQVRAGATERVVLILP